MLVIYVGIVGIPMCLLVPRIILVLGIGWKTSNLYIMLSLPGPGLTMEID
jgi:hypothetical protein